MLKEILQISHVSKIYELGGETVKALDDVSFAIKEGEFVAITGPSGSGKSTLMHVVGALDTPSFGQVKIDGEDIAKMTQTELARVRNRKIGFVFQQFNLLSKTSSLNNVEIPLIYGGITKYERTARAEEMLRKVGLGEHMKNHPNQLSGGQQQRVAIARALVNNPAIILADEPTGNLDSKTGDDIMALFKSLHHEGHTVILVTHEKDIANQAHRIIMLKDGKIVH